MIIFLARGHFNETFTVVVLRPIVAKYRFTRRTRYLWENKSTFSNYQYYLQNATTLRVNDVHKYLALSEHNSEIKSKHYNPHRSVLKWMQYKLKIKFVLLKRVVEGIKNGVYCSFSLDETVCLIYKWGIKWRHLIDTVFLLIGKSCIHYSTKLQETLETAGLKKITFITRKHCYSDIHALRLRSLASVNKDYSFFVNLVPRAFCLHGGKSAKIALHRSVR